VEKVELARFLWILCRNEARGLAQMMRDAGRVSASEPTQKACRAAVAGMLRASRDVDAAGQKTLYDEWLTEQAR
jgi:hypothetical protein